MPRYEFRLPRLHVEDGLSAGAQIALDRAQSNYLLNVLRMKDGDEVLLFNGRDGEWRATLRQEGRKQASLAASEMTRPQAPLPDLHYLFAPLKHARLDYMVQKAVEMGAGALRPVLTRYTQSGRVNLERMRSNAVEACEQCGVLAVPAIDEPVTLEAVLAGWQENEGARMLIFCDEGEASQNPLAALDKLSQGVPLAVLVGPEGGFSEEERALLRTQPFVVPMPLGPRVLRADTAAVAALAVVQARLGDWH